MKPKIHLLTRADDAGSCRSANEAILEGVEAGIFGNVSFMAVGPEIEHAVELLRGRDDMSSRGNKSVGSRSGENT